jgi:predicted transcriptional regulator
MVTKLITVRLDTDLIKRLDRLAQAMEKQTGITGLKVTRTQAISTAVTMGLEEAEATFAVTPKKR